MFGIGLPEMILILALALIVVGPDKLPDLARSIAKGIMELKKTAEGLKKNFEEETHSLKEIAPDLEQAARNFKGQILDLPSPESSDSTSQAPAEQAAKAYDELTRAGVDTTATVTPPPVEQQETPSEPPPPPPSQPTGQQ